LKEEFQGSHIKKIKVLDLKRVWSS